MQEIRKRCDAGLFNSVKSLEQCNDQCSSLSDEGTCKSSEMKAKLYYEVNFKIKFKCDIEWCVFVATKQKMEVVLFDQYMNLKILTI